MAFRTTTHDGKERIEARCAKHAGIIKRTRWPGGELVDLTPEVVDAITTRVAEAKARRDAERAAKREQDAIRMEAARVEAHELDAVAWSAGPRRRADPRRLGRRRAHLPRRPALGGPPRGRSGLGHRHRQGRPTRGGLARGDRRSRPRAASPAARRSRSPRRSSPPPARTPPTATGSRAGTPGAPARSADDASRTTPPDAETGRSPGPPETPPGADEAGDHQEHHDGHQEGRHHQTASGMRRCIGSDHVRHRGARGAGRRLPRPGQPEGRARPDVQAALDRVHPGAPQGLGRAEGREVVEPAPAPEPVAEPEAPTPRKGRRAKAAPEPEAVAG